MDPKKVRKIWRLINDAFWFIQVNVVAIKSINQKGNNLLSEAHGQAASSCTSPPQGPPPSQDSTWPSLGDHVAGDRKDPLRFRWSSWHWEDHLDELGKKGEMRLVMLPSFQWWFMGSPLVGLYLHRGHFAMTPSRLSPKYLQTLDACFFGTALFFWMGGCRSKR